MKRVFVGIKINDDLSREIVSWQKKQINKNVRWIIENNLHLTLVPPWYEEDIEGVKDYLDKLELNLSPFEILFERILFGPTIRDPRLIWVQGPIPSEVLNLKRRIEENLGIIPEKREFKFHITLGRFKDRGFQNLKYKIQMGGISWKMKVESICLFESILSPNGADYRVLKEIKLQ